MIADQKVLAVVAGRGGSKGLPRKNVLPVGGRPMIAWSVAAGQSAALVDRVIVSTDDAEIAEVARQAGGDVPFLRPAALANDQASVYDALFHAIDTIDGIFGWVVLLQATSPLRTGADIDAALALCERSGAPACISVTTPPKPPYWMFSMGAGGHLHRLLEPPAAADRRQELPPAYVPNGAVYVARIDWLRQCRNFLTEETVALVMPPERSVDVDHRLDLLVAEALFAEAKSVGSQAVPSP